MLYTTCRIHTSYGNSGENIVKLSLKNYNNTSLLYRILTVNTIGLLHALDRSCTTSLVITEGGGGEGQLNDGK